MVRCQRQLSSAVRKNVARAAALAASFDIYPLSFYDVHAVMQHFAETLSETSQTVPLTRKINSESYLPGRTAVMCALKEVYRLSTSEAYGRW